MDELRDGRGYRKALIRRELARATIALVCMVMGVQMCSAKSVEEGQDKPLLASMILSAPIFTVESVPDLLVKFALKNTGKVPVDPAITRSELLIDGKVYKDSALLFGNGPRDGRFKSLAPGEKIEFSYPLGHFFPEAGDHVLLWRGVSFKDTRVPVKVTELTSPWKTIAKSSWAEVAAERALYRARTGKNFYIHVRIKNLIDRPIGLEAGDRFKMFFPNQWAESLIPRRQVISETRRNQDELSSDEKSKLINMFKSTATGKEMIKIPALKAYEYFISFNGGGYDQLEKAKCAYVIIVMDGRIGLTDGKEVTTVRRPMNDSLIGEVPVKTPVSFRWLPSSKGALFED